MKLHLVLPFALGGLLMGGCIPLLIHAASRGDHEDSTVTVTSPNVTIDGNKITIDTGGDSSQIVGSGALKTENRSVGDFHGISVGSVLRLRYTTGPTTDVKVEAQPNVLSHLTTRVDKGILRCELNGNFRNIQPVTVTVTSPHLDYLEASGASDAVADGIQADVLQVDVSGSSKAKVDGDARVVKTDVSGAAELTGALSGKGGLSAQVSGNAKVILAGPFGDGNVDCSGAGEVQVDHVDARQFEVTSSGSSHVTASGSADTLAITCEGDGEADLSSLAAKDCKATASGAAHIITNVSGTLNAEASGAADVQYRGKASVNRSVSGAAHIESLIPGE